MGSSPVGPTYWALVEWFKTSDFDSDMGNKSHRRFESCTPNKINLENILEKIEFLEDVSILIM